MITGFVISVRTCLQPPGTHRYGHDIRARLGLLARLGSQRGVIVSRATALGIWIDEV